MIQEVAFSIEKADKTKTVSEKALVERFALTAEGLCQNYLLTTPGWKRIMVMTRGQSGQLNLNLGHNNAESRIFQNLGLTIGGYVNFPNGAYGSSYGTYARNGDNSMPTIYQVYNNEFGDDVNKYPERRARIAKVRMGYPVPGTDYEQINDDGSVTTAKLTNPINCYFDIYVDFDIAIATRSGVQLQVSYSGKSNNNGVEPIVSETDATDIGIKKEQLTYFEFEPKMGVNLYDPNCLNILNELESKNIKSNSIEANVILVDSIQQKTETVSTLGADKLEIYSNKKKVVNPIKVTYTISGYDATNPPRIEAYRKYNMLYKSHLSLYGSYTRPSGVTIESFQDGTFTINTNGNTTSSAEVFSNSRYASVFNGLESDSFKGSDEDKMIYLPAGKYVVINCQIYDETGAVIANGGLGTGKKFTTTSDKWVSLARVHVPKSSKLNGSIRYVPILMEDQGATYYTAQLNTKTNMAEIECQPEEDNSWTITFPIEELFSTSYKGITGYSNGNYVIDIKKEQMFKDGAITNDASEALKMFKEVTKDNESQNPYVTYYNIAKTGSYTFYNSIGVDLIDQLNNKLDKNGSKINLAIGTNKIDINAAQRYIDIYDPYGNQAKLSSGLEGSLDLSTSNTSEHVKVSSAGVTYEKYDETSLTKTWPEILEGSGGSDIDLSDYVKKSEAPGYNNILTETEAQSKYQPKGNYIKQDEDINLGTDYPEHATLTSTSLDFTNDDSVEYSILNSTNLSFYDDNEGVESSIGLQGLYLSSHAESYLSVNLDNIQGTSVDGSDDIKQSFKNFLEVPTKTSQLTNDNNFITSPQVDAKLASLVDSAPDTLNTLNELADALGDDPNFATTVANQIGSKVDKTTTVNGHALSGNVTITKSDIAGLENVDNTADADKNVNSASYATSAYSATIANHASTSDNASHADYASSAGSASSSNTVSIGREGSSAYYPVLFTSIGVSDGQQDRPYAPINNTVAVNPATGEVAANNFVGNLNGTADKAINDSYGRNISATYFAQGNESIELNENGTLKGYGGFIDFHYHSADGTPSANTDYSSRILETADGELTINNVKITTDGTVHGNLNGTASKATSLEGQDTITTAEGMNNFLTGNKLQYATFKLNENMEGLDFGSNDGMVLSIPWYENSYGAQLAFDDSGSNIAVRSKAGTWDTWKKLIHTGNIGAQSVNYANSAGSATYDSNGNYIPDYYATKAQLNSLTATSSGTHSYSGEDFGTDLDVSYTASWIKYADGRYEIILTMSGFRIAGNETWTELPFDVRSAHAVSTNPNAGVTIGLSGSRTVYFYGSYSGTGLTMKIEGLYA